MVVNKTRAVLLPLQDSDMTLNPLVAVNHQAVLEAQGKKWEGTEIGIFFHGRMKKEGLRAQKELSKLAKPINTEPLTQSFTSFFLLLCMTIQDTTSNPSSGTTDSVRPIQTPLRPH